MPGRCARWAGVAWSCALLTLLPGSTAQAQKQGQAQKQPKQKVLFKPELFVGGSHTDNALRVGEPERESTIYQAGAIFPFTRIYPGGRFNLSYAPLYEQFQDVDELDNLNHRANLGWAAKPSKRSTFGLRARYARIQDDRTANLRRPVPFLRVPLTRELAAADLSFGRRFAQSWNWSGGVGFSNWSFDPIEEDPTPEIDEDLTTDVEDRQETRARIGLSWGQTPGFKVGGQYAVRRFDLDVSGEETAHLVSLTVDGAAKDRFKLSFGVGGFLTEGDSDEPDVADGTDASDDSDRGAQGWLTLSRTFSENTLILTLSHRPSVGGTRLGTSELSTADLGIHGSTGEVWYWGLRGRYGRREPRLTQGTEIEIFGGDGYIERRFQKVVGLRLGAGYAQQTANIPEQEGEVFRGNLTLVLYPLARTRLGGDTPDTPGNRAAPAAATPD